MSPQELVDPAVREHPVPDQHAGDERHDVRQEEQDPEDAGAAQVARWSRSATANGTTIATGSEMAANLQRDGERLPVLLVGESVW